jgi:uncharacterized protein YcfJ
MKRAICLTFAVLAVLLIYGGFTPMPSGANDLVLPGPDKSFEQFQADDSFCRQWADQNSLPPRDFVNQTTIQGAVMGTLWGAGLGAAIGAISGDAGVGAAIGAGSGLILGAVSGADAGRQSNYEAQQRYNSAYQHCMYSQGNPVPNVTVDKSRTIRTAPPPLPSSTGKPMNRYDPPYPFLFRD